MSSLLEHTILILEDDELWLARHERRLKQAGLECYATDSAKDALRALKTNPAIKFALIDEILYVPPIPVEEADRELQSLQGIDVIREINRQRTDIQFIIVTSAPYSRSAGDTQLFRRETAKLRRHPGVVDIIHKVDIDEDPAGAYDWLIDLLKQPRSAAKTETVTPRILIGLGFDKTAHEAMAEQMELPRRQYMAIAPLVKKAGHGKFLDELWERAQEKSVLLEMPGSKKLDRLTVIKPGSQDFEILACLAKKAEARQDVLMQEHDYKHAKRKPKKQVDDLPVYDPREVQDFMYEYADDGSGRRLGIQIEGKSDQNSPLKVAVHRLGQRLSKLNVGPARQLFTHEQGGYRPSFELGIVVYATRSQKSTSTSSA